MKKLVFSRKLFVRHPEQDFRDDGTSFRLTYYKDTVPVSVASWNGMRFVAIRLDYAGIDWNQYKEDYSIIDEFNGVADNKFDMDKFVANCEFMLNKYFGK